MPKFQHDKFLYSESKGLYQAPHDLSMMSAVVVNYVDVADLKAVVIFL